MVGQSLPSSQNLGKLGGLSYDWHSRAWSGAQEQIIISVAAICPHSKGNKESLNLAYGLTRLRCLVRVSLGLKYKTSVLAGSYQETGKLLALA